MFALFTHRAEQCPLLWTLAACTDRELICAQLKLMYSFDVKSSKYFRHWRAGGRRSERHCKGAVLLIDHTLSSSWPLFRWASSLQVIRVLLQMQIKCFVGVWIWSNFFREKCWNHNAKADTYAAVALNFQHARFLRSTLGRQRGQLDINKPSFFGHETWTGDPL